MSLLASLRSLGSHLSCPGGPLSLRAGIGQALGPAAAQMFVRGMKVRSAIKKRCEATLKTRSASGCTSVQQAPEKLPGHPKASAAIPAQADQLGHALASGSRCRVRGHGRDSLLIRCCPSPQVRGVLLRQAGQHLVRLLQGQPEAQATPGTQAQAGYRPASHCGLHALEHARRQLDVSGTAAHDQAARSARAALREKAYAQPRTRRAADPRCPAPTVAYRTVGELRAASPGVLAVSALGYTCAG